MDAPAIQGKEDTRRPPNGPSDQPFAQEAVTSLVTRNAVDQSDQGEDHAEPVSRFAQVTQPAPGLEPGTARLQGGWTPPHLAPYQRRWVVTPSPACA